MRVVSIMNYKGGVGKTTLAANLGAGLASAGRKVLLIDLDPQTNLTLSFYSPIDWQAKLAPDKTIKRWFDSHLAEVNGPSLADLIVTPKPVEELVNGGGGKLDLIASHLQLVEIDMELSRDLFHSDSTRARSRRVRLYRILADALEDDALAGYDYVLIDCAPDFGLVTQLAMVASGWLLTPTKADHLSTLSITYFTESVRRLIDRYNSISSALPSISPQFLGAVFTMVQPYGGHPTSIQQLVIDDIAQNVKVAEGVKMPVFKSWIRNSPKEAITSAREGIPTVLRSGADVESAEFKALTDEFIRRIEA